MPKKRKLLESTAVRRELRSLSDPDRAGVLSRYFKTGKGEYGEGDRFLGVAVPDIRKIVKSHRDAERKEVLKLLRSAYHEDRLAALLILVEQYKRGDASRRKAIYSLYLSNTGCINNWDLVDLSAPHIVGAHLFGKSTSMLTELAISEYLWERRIAILSTHYFIRQGDSGEALRIAELLVHDSHDLIHKAVGWMLREVGKRCSVKNECKFLDSYAAVMPRTMLRYAVERFPEKLKRKYMKKARR